MKRLFRVPAEGRIAGVCAGIARYVDADVTLVRLAWVILSIIPGALVGGAIAYLAAWMLMPVSLERESGAARPRLTRSLTDRQIAGLCGGLAEYFAIDATAVRVAVVILAIYPGAVIGGVIAYAVAWFIVPPAASGPLVDATAPAQ